MKKMSSTLEVIKASPAIESPTLEMKHKSVSYAKWGYIFITPFFVAYLICSFIPQVLTVYNSFFENYKDGLKQIGPNFVGLGNYIKLFTPDSSGGIGFIKYMCNTFVIWIMGAIPQMTIALLLGVWFTSSRLNIKGQPFFKSVIYMPNLIMASAFSMLFFTMFSNVGPINQMLMQLGITDKVITFLNLKFSVRSLIAGMNFLMWFGNSTILLMAGIMGIDESLFESATIDGASSWKVFAKITLPLLMPILIYVIITSMIGGIQLFDVPQVLTNRLGNPDRSTMTLIMYLNSYLSTSKNFGMSGAISVCIFIITAILSLYVYGTLNKQYRKKG